MKVELLSVMGDDLHVVNCARVSMGKWHDDFDESSDTRLIHYLAREGHWTPFAQPQVCFRIEAPIFVARQWYRHTAGVVRSETSRRYIDSDPEFFFPETWRARPDKNIKQGSGGDLPPEQQAQIAALYGKAVGDISAVYDRLIQQGVAPEQARMVLPQSMYTIWVETGSLAYWARLCSLRLKGHAQAEIKDLAGQVADDMRERFPVSWDALVNV